MPINWGSATIKTENTQTSGTSPVSVVPAPPRPPVLLALAPDRYKLQVTISESTQQKLRQARELLGHQIPDGNMAQILDRALDLLVEKLRKQKFGGTGRKRRSNGTS